MKNYSRKEMRLNEACRPSEEMYKWRSSALHVDRFANLEARTKVIFHHGVGTNGRLLSLIVGAPLFRRGFEVVSIDMPLYGMSETNEKGIRYDDWVNISSEFINSEVRRDGRPIVLYGFSAGGMLCYHSAAVNGNVKGTVGMCFLDMRDENVRRSISDTPKLDAFLIRLAYLLAKTPLGRLKVPMKRISKMSALSNHPQAQAILISDPCSGGARVSLEFVSSFLRYQPAIEPAQFALCPILLTQPGLDRWTPLEVSQGFMDKLTVDKEVVILEGAGHYPMEQPGLKQMENAIVDFIKRIDS